MNQNGRRSISFTRDPNRTRRRILTAALREFSANGFAGARVNSVARRAQVNKRLLYHYFGNKEKLFGAVLLHKIAERRAWTFARTDDPTKPLAFWFQQACGEAHWIRLLQWESLQRRKNQIVDEKGRRAAAVDWLQRIRQWQDAGRLNRSFDASYLALAMQSMSVFPAAFPQVAFLTTGQSVADPGFQSGYRKFLQTFATALQTPNGQSFGCE